MTEREEAAQDELQTMEQGFASPFWKLYRARLEEAAQRRVEFCGSGTSEPLERIRQCQHEAAILRRVAREPLDVIRRP